MTHVLLKAKASGQEKLTLNGHNVDICTQEAVSWGLRLDPAQKTNYEQSQVFKLD